MALHSPEMSGRYKRIKILRLNFLVTLTKSELPVRKPFSIMKQTVLNAHIRALLLHYHYIVVWTRIGKGNYTCIITT